MSLVFPPDGMEGVDILPTDGPTGTRGKSSPSMPTKDANTDNTEPDENISQDAQVHNPLEA